MNVRVRVTGRDGHVDKCHVDATVANYFVREGIGEIVADDPMPQPEPEPNESETEGLTDAS